MKKVLLIRGINPQPWVVPDLGVGRSNGRVYPTATKRAELRAYQEAILETVEASEFNIDMFPADMALDVSFYFWRRLDEYTAASGTKVRKQKPDTTNMVKSTEDALQKVLYANDRQNIRVSGLTVAFGTEVEPAVLVVATPLARAMLATWDEVLDNLKSETTGDVYYYEAEQ